MMKTNRREVMLFKKKTIKKNYDKENHSDLHQTRNPKHRYVYLVGTKRDKKQMLKELRYPVYDHYPKGDERRYDTDNPQIAIPIEIVT